MQNGIYVLDGLVPIVDCLMPFSTKKPFETEAHTQQRSKKHHPSTGISLVFNHFNNGDLVGNYIKLPSG